MSAAAQAFLSLDQFEERYGDRKPYHEYWFGEAIPKGGSTSLHGVFQAILGMLIMQQGWKVSSEVRLKLSSYANPVPDLVADAKSLQFPYPTKPFDLCIEIVSPDDKLPKLFQKGAQYLDWGIRTVWIVDPQERNGFLMTPESPVPVETEMLTAASEARTLSIAMERLLAEVALMVA